MSPTYPGVYNGTVVTPIPILTAEPVPLVEGDKWWITTGGTRQLQECRKLWNENTLSYELVAVTLEGGPCEPGPPGGYEPVL